MKGLVNMKKHTAGIHHITAIVGHPQENIDFYAGVLGLRLVKQTVNFDDPGTYHLYFGDKVENQEQLSPSSHGLMLIKDVLVMVRLALQRMLYQKGHCHFGLIA